MTQAPLPPGSDPHVGGGVCGLVLSDPRCPLSLSPRSQVLGAEGL